MLYIASANDELKLISSLKTLGYIEFDVLCNLSDLEEQLFEHAELSWCSRHTYHAIGKYDNNGKYLIHRVYICANLNFPFVVQDCNQLNGSNTTDIHMPSIPMLPFVITNLLYDRVEKNVIVQDHVHSDQGACRISFEYNWRRGWLFFQEGEDDEDMTCMLPAILGDSHEDERDQQASQSRRRPKAHLVGVPKLVAKTTQVRVHLGVQEQPTPKMMPRSHTESVLNVLYMDGKIISRSFQWHQFQAKFIWSRQ